MSPKSVFSGLAIILLGFALANASAVLVTFSGGSGNPLSMTLAEPVSYEITTSTIQIRTFVFEDVGNIFGATFPLATPNITLTINDGPTPDDRCPQIKIVNYELMNGAIFVLNKKQPAQNRNPLRTGSPMMLYASVFIAKSGCSLGLTSGQIIDLIG